MTSVSDQHLRSPSSTEAADLGLGSSGRWRKGPSSGQKVQGYRMRPPQTLTSPVLLLLLCSLMTLLFRRAGPESSYYCHSVYKGDST